MLVVPVLAAILIPLSPSGVRARVGKTSGFPTRALESGPELPATFADTTPVNVEQLVIRALGSFSALHHANELSRLCGCVEALAPRTVVEIGTASGGMFFCACQLAAADALLVSIDVGESGLGGQPDEDCELFRSFALPNQECHFVRGSSLALSSRRTLEKILDRRSIDFLFIDGDHSYGAVKSDFETYAPLVSAGGTIVLHDIQVSSEAYGSGFNVNVYWNELKQRHRTEEIVDAEGARSPGERRGSFLRSARPRRRPRTTRAARDGPIRDLRGGDRVRARSTERRRKAAGGRLRAGTASGAPPNLIRLRSDHDAGHVIEASVRHALHASNCFRALAC